MDQDRKGLPISHQDDDPRSFFDQLSPLPQDTTPEGIPSQLTSSTADITANPHPELMIPSSITVDQVPPQPSQTNLLVGQQCANVTNESQGLMKGSQSPASYDQLASPTSLPVTVEQGTPVVYPPYQQTDLILPQNVQESHLTIPLTPQANPPSNESLYAPQVPTPETPQSTSSQPLPTQLTPIQSAMMMSMTTSMMAAATSPNASMDVEATTVKFQQASLNSDVYPNTPQSESSVTSSGTVALDNVSVSNPMSTGISTSAATSEPKTQTSNMKAQISLGLAHESVLNRPKQSESKLHKYFSTTKAPNPFESIGGNILGSCNDSAMINPVYMSPTDGFNISNAIPSPDSFLTPATEQDVFTASLLSSDADRRHDAWIPSEATRQALISMSTSPPGTYFPEKELLTMPGIAVKEDFGDPVKNLVRTYLGEEQSSKRVVLTATSVTQDDRGLRQLIAAGCYHAAVNLTTQLLTVYGQGEGRAGHPSKHTAHSIQLWFTRIALLVKLRRFSLAEVECQYFNDLDAPDLYFEFYPELYGGRKGSMVPFSFRLLVAELPQHLGKHTQALDRLNALLRTCNKIIKNLNTGLSEDGSNLEMTNNMRDDSLKLWRTRRHRVMYSITNCAVSLKDFRLAGSLIQRLIQEDPNSAAGLYSALGRLCLQLGDVTAAQETFNQYFEHSLPPPHHDPVQGLLHSAYISIAQNAFKDAAEILQQAHKLNPSNGLVINNYGVCLMYTGRVSEAITLVEGAVFSQPDRFLHEAIVLNLATMYELESSNAHQKKLKLLSLIAQHKGDSFNVAALKLQPQ
ncbi:trafficking protein particle complex subunit 12-like isoform X1 [Eriocheir sinensis]|uniref:trafficking protein particle complex subunit 12-like isoform X1 n=1 Tax=Eriocheir sinensis TaxID=95602 RepID=UPI0021C96747|nr:trafficking protein particle complex subunit 12-like isoform X1 [Eriocheir sinensis]